MIAPTNCNPDCDCAQRMVRCRRAAPPPMVIPASLAPPCGTPDQYGWSCCGSDPCKRRRAVEAAIRKDWEQHQDYELEGVIPDMTVDGPLAELEKEFSATMGIVPTAKVTSLTFDDVERISEYADKYDRIAAAIESDAEWFVDNSIDDADIAKGLRLAAKALRNGVQP